MYYKYRKNGEIYMLFACTDNNGTYKEEYHPINKSKSLNIVLSKTYMSEDNYMAYLYELEHTPTIRQDLLKELKDYHYKLYCSAIDKVKKISEKIFEKYDSISATDNYHDEFKLDLRDIKEYISLDDVEYTTDEQPVYDYRNIPKYVKVVTNLKCPMCGSEMKCDCESQLLSPPKHRYVCSKCMYVANI